MSGQPLIVEISVEVDIVARNRLFVGALSRARRTDYWRFTSTGDEEMLVLEYDFVGSVWSDLR